MQTASIGVPVTIAVAPNGGRRTHVDHPRIPLTPLELARDAAECRAAGAVMIHVHVRDGEGGHVLDADAYRDALDAIKAAVGDNLAIQITSEALGIYQPDQQMAVVRQVRPEAVSLALRELVPTDKEEKLFADFLNWLKRERIAPQIILYTPEEAVRLGDMIGRGLVPFSDPPVLYVLGRYTAGQVSAPADLLPFIAPGLPAFSDWSVCAFGAAEAACVMTGTLLGGHVRVGFENNLLLPDGRRAGSNAELVATIADVADQLGRPPGTADALRERWARLFST